MPQTGDVDAPFDVIVIGQGIAAAEYLATMPRLYASLKDDEPLPPAPKEPEWPHLVPTGPEPAHEPEETSHV